MRHQSTSRHHPLVGTAGRRIAPPPTANHAVEWNDERSCFVATCTTAAEAEGTGDTAAEALRDLRSAMTRRGIA